MILTKSATMHSIDKKTIEDCHIPGILLMEHAAVAVVDAVPQNLARGTVVCSTGNNGGDGLAAARLLLNRGCSVSVVMTGDPFNIKPDAKIMFDALEHLNIDILWFKEETFDEVRALLLNSDFIVDAIFGIGCSRVIKDDYYKLISLVNEAETFVVSVDIPSGVNSDNGKIMGIHVNADVTVTFTLPKLGNILYPGALASKQLKVVDIGIPQSVLEQYEFSYETLDSETLRLLPSRRTVSHKMSYGRILIIAGSKGMSGAAYLASKSAYRSGGGLVEIVTHDSCKQELQVTIPEAIVTTYTDDFESLQEVMERLVLQIDQYDVILVGPGMTTSEASGRWLEFSLTQGTVPVVVDADGLNLLSKNLEVLEEVNVPLVLTPHIGEMARLTGYPGSAVLENTVEFSQAFSKSHNVVVALKSARTVVTNQKGDCCINICGNDGMATAGSGDVLAGIITGLIGQGVEPYKGACVGVALHSLAGDAAAAKTGKYSMMASDIIDNIETILK